MKDAFFWTKLAYSACGWLQESEDASLRQFWIDDFLPEAVTDTKRGVEVQGTAWVGDFQRRMDPYRFNVSVPQKMLHRRRDSFLIEQIVLDEKHRTLWVEIATEKHLA